MFTKFFCIRKWRHWSYPHAPRLLKIATDNALLLRELLSENYLNTSLTYVLYSMYCQYMKFCMVLLLLAISGPGYSIMSMITPDIVSMLMMRVFSGIHLYDSHICCDPPE